MKLYVFLWERHLAAMIVAGSHSHKGDTSLPAGRRTAPYPALLTPWARNFNTRAKALTARQDAVTNPAQFADGGFGNGTRCKSVTVPPL